MSVERFCHVSGRMGCAPNVMGSCQHARMNANIPVDHIERIHAKIERV